MVKSPAPIHGRQVGRGLAGRRKPGHVQGGGRIRSLTATILESMLLREFFKIGHSGHLAVIAHDLADNGGWLLEPASLARSTPPSLFTAGARKHAVGLGPQRKKNMAGRDQVLSGLALSATATWMVRARSAAEMPVAMPSRASMEIVKLVPKRGKIAACHQGQPELVAHSSGAIGRQIRPRPNLAMKLMASGA